MALSEFGLIRRFFTTRQTCTHPATRLGIGDDCALLTLDAERELAVTADTLVAGVHFFADTDPRLLGHKVLAVNLSDLAAMGAEPAWATLALTLPNTDEHWLDQFSRGFLDLAAHYGVELIGGDTTRGPLSFTVQAMGMMPAGQALRRSAARVGDRIYVTGYIGDAGLGLAIEQQHSAVQSNSARLRLLSPQPRIEAGLLLRGLAHAAIDVSDGLSADLSHMLSASQVGAELYWEQLPLSPAVHDWIAETGNWIQPLSAGDDYELCFTVPASRCTELEQRAQQLDYPVTCIGGIAEAGQGLTICKDQHIHTLTATGYEHFRPTMEF